MSQWGKNRQSNNAPIWGSALLNKAPNTANRDDLYLNSTGNDYTTGETHSIVGIKASELSSNVVVGVDVTASGNSYTAQPNVAFSSGGGTGAAGDVWARVTSFALNGPGTGGNYVPGETLTVSTGTGTAATVNVTATEARTVAISVAGSGYANTNVVTAITGSGTAATFTITTGAADTIPASLALTSRGTYTTNPTLANNSVTGGAGTGLKVDLTMRVKTIAALSNGSYSAIPTLTAVATSGSTTGTAATLNLTMGVEKIVMSNTGSAYTSAPTVTFGGTGGTGSTGTAVITSGNGVCSQGWILTKTGTGGRAGRVQREVLVAVKSLT